MRFWLLLKSPTISSTNGLYCFSNACLITGITPEDHPEALSEYELALRINEEFSEPYTVVCGFNNIRFDDEMVRSLLYRNLLDPYEREWKDGCSRWDILDLVRAAYDFRPAGIEWPVKNKDTGNPVFKLTELTQANHIDQTGAHGDFPHQMESFV